MSTIRSRVLAVLAASCAVLAPASPAHAAGHTADISVTTPKVGAFVLSDDEHRAGPVRFHFVSHAAAGPNGGGSDVELVGLHRGVSLSQALSHIRAQNQPSTKAGLAAAAASTRWLNRHVTGYGGAAIQGVGTADVTLFLPTGTSYLVDINSVFSGSRHPFTHHFRTFGRPAAQRLPALAGMINPAEPNRFRVDRSRTTDHDETVLPAGRYLIRNQAKSIHFVVFAPVKPGTTNAVISRGVKAINHGMKPPVDPYLHDKTAVQAGVISPGQQEVFSSRLLSPGTYDLECFIADDMTGLPHFFMGMHHIVIVR